MHLLQAEQQNDDVDSLPRQSKAYFIACLQLIEPRAHSSPVKKIHLIKMRLLQTIQGSEALTRLYGSDAPPSMINPQNDTARSLPIPFVQSVRKSRRQSIRASEALAHLYGHNSPFDMVHSQTHSPLFKLPAELRNKVYDYATCNGSSGSQNLQFLMTCKQIRSEATALAWANTVFVFDSSNRPAFDLRDRLQKITSERKANIVKLAIRLVDLVEMAGADIYKSYWVDRRRDIMTTKMISVSKFIREELPSLRTLCLRETDPPQSFDEISILDMEFSIGVAMVDLSLVLRLDNLVLLAYYGTFRVEEIQGFFEVGAGMSGELELDQYLPQEHGKVLTIGPIIQIGGYFDVLVGLKEDVLTRRHVKVGVVNSLDKIKYMYVYPNHLADFIS
ncbi:hypothetical protein EJ08DRAFT_276515 [Tothia fuscella]|uniref:F-box domain-containing protein n=1 Tax=Tothia fuscella TaxID=1048955 RepID=A0A9P4TX99_9PEZI|nr:hypothetical protein EJ08DRAFT_276515 [Tothia fuscella]